jgi:hypothetical protein
MISWKCTVDQWNLKHLFRRVLRCSFVWLKLQHISERPYSCSVNFHIKFTSQAYGRPPLCPLMCLQSSHISQAPAVCPLMSSSPDAHVTQMPVGLHTYRSLLSISHHTTAFTKCHYIYVHTSHYYTRSSTEMCLGLCLHDHFCTEKIQISLPLTWYSDAPL